MFLICSNCDFKYLVNSADLKPNGRMVECANCNHQWFQEPDNTETISAVPSTNNKKTESRNSNNNKIDYKSNLVKNLPSTIVREEIPSIRNSLIVVFIIVCIFSSIWFTRSYGINTFVLIEFYIREFFFNFNLIIADLAKIIHDTLN